MADIVELDFGMGNIRSLQKALEHLEAKVEVTSDYKRAAQADILILPGDGAFGKAMEELKHLHLLEVVQEFAAKKKPILGICIGFQILFTSSTEFGYEEGMNLFSGGIERFPDKKDLTVPHIGWNQVAFKETSILGKNIPTNSFFYFVHSYRLNGNHPHASATAHYDEEFTAVVEKDNIFAAQFHPEKSHKSGLQFLKNFLKEVGC